MKCNRCLFLLCFLMTQPAGHARRVTIEAIGGTNLTNHFPVTQYATPADQFGNPPTYFRFGTGGGSPILGAFIETRLTNLFSLEADVLHRPMRLEITFKEFLPDNTNRTASNEQTAVRAWPFPLPLKVRLPVAGRLQPFGYNPSHYGMTVGGGVETEAGSTSRLPPAMRYTRWAKDEYPFPPIPGVEPEYSRTISNAVELVFGVSF